MAKSSSANPRRTSDPGHTVGRRWLVLFAAAAAVAPAMLGAAEPPVRAGLRPGLADVEASPETSSESTIVEIPVPITLKGLEDGGIGVRLRLSVFFAWNDVRFEDLGGDDIAASLQTLTVVPGVEFLVPVGRRWLVRPYVQVGGLDALRMDGHRWLGSVGSRAGADWDFERWRLQAGGRLEYTLVLDEEWRRSDEVAFVDIGADFSWPLWFNVKGEPAAAGFYVIPRAYFNPAVFVGQDGFDLGVDSHLEVGVSFQIHDKPRLWFVKLPAWYGVGVRLAERHRSVRIYLGFPF